MNRRSEILVRVHLAWNGWQSAEIPFDALTGIHWRQPPGAPHHLIHGCVDCRTAADRGLPHCCDGTPHQLLVCILKHHATEPVYAVLVRAADERRGLARAAAAS
jgi:hypothetical protein